MKESLLFLGILTLFGPFVLMAGRRTEDQKRRMTTRFRLVDSRFRAELEENLQSRSNLTGVQQKSGRLTIQVLNRILEAIQFRSLAARAGYRRSESTFLAVCVNVQLSIAGLVWLTTHFLVGAIVLGSVAGYAPVILLKIRCGRRLRKFEKGLPQVVEMMARALRAGHSLAAALSIVAEQAPEPARQEFMELFRKQKFGFPLREGLLELLERLPSQDLRVLVVGILVQRETGGNLTVILDRTSSVIRERLRLQGDVLVHTAQGRFTGWILCALPVILFVMLHMVNPGYTKDLTEDPLGRNCLYGAIGLLVLGAYIIRKIISGIEV